MAALYDSRGNPITLGDKIGEGGEGAVYHVQGHQHLVAKLYRRSVPPERAEKLIHMLRQRTSALIAHSAWPVDLLYQTPKPSRDSLVGLMMAKITAGKAIHQLYNPRSRRQAFPQADWRFLIHVATNIARAFGSVHEHGHVIGDVNHGNIVVDQKGMVRLIDCDSFQISGGGKVFLCEVGVPEYTPPELQGQPLAKITRTTHHDGFGLAVLIFQLLMMGRHPFSGTYFGKGDMPLERAIKEARFAYGSRAEARQMRPPPNTLVLSDISPDIEALFERAFGASRTTPSRPSANEWIEALTQLSENLCACATNDSHLYLNTLQQCPWCQLESRGVTLFGAATPATVPEVFNLNAMWNIVSAIKSPMQIAVPIHNQIVPIQQLNRARWQSLGYRLLIAAALVSTIGFDALLVWWSQWLAALAVTSVATVSVWRMWFHSSPRLATWYADYAATHKTYSQLMAAWEREADVDQFTAAKAKAEQAKNELTALNQQREQRMQTLRKQPRERQLFYFLSSYRIENSHLDGISSARRTALIEAGILTAADVTAEAINQIVGFGPQLSDKLCAWRTELEANFRFDPNRGIDPRDIRALDQEFGALQKPWQEILEAAPKELLAIKESVEQAQSTLLPRIESSVDQLDHLSTNYPALPAPHSAQVVQD